MISSYLSSIFIYIRLRTALYPSAEARYGLSQASKMDFFARIINVFILTLPTTFAKISFHLGCLKRLDHTSDNEDY